MRILVFAAALIACGSPQQRPPDQLRVDFQVDVTADNYAAMEEVPVAGGELRLVAPRETIDDHGARLAEIAFPLLHTDVAAKVSGMSAMYTVTQTFENPYDEPIDAVYVFPLGDEGAITSYAIVIGDRTVAGEIKKKEEARDIYEEAKAAGHTAALLEQQKKNVFRQRIANIAPHEQIKVRMQYSELLGYTDGQYELVFPFVVGPRYLPISAIGSAPVAAHRAGHRGRNGVTSIPYASDHVAAGTVSFAADVDAGVPVLAVTSPSHELRVDEPTPTHRKIALANAGEIPNRDLVVRYKTAGDQTMIGLLAHRPLKGDKRGYFTLMVQPKAAYKTGDIAPREVMIVVDTSGSMNGEPIAQAQRLAGVLVESLRPTDTFNIMTFAGVTNVMAPIPVAGDPQGKTAGKAFLEQLEAGGGTEMGEAMVKALATKPGNDRIRIVYFLTDGFVGNDDVIVNAARGNLGINRIFSVGIGSAPNRALLDEIAAVGRGFPTYLNLTESADDVGEELVRRTAFPYLTDVKIDWGGLAVGAVTPAAIPDVYAGMPLVVSGVYTHPGHGKIVVHAKTAGHRVEIPLEITLPERVDDEPVAALWARRRIDELYALAGDQITSATSSEVTALGLQFHMVTEYTSFVAVDRTRVVNAGGKSRIVEQPAIMPAGVDANAALGDDSRKPVADRSASVPTSSYSGGGGGGYGGGGDVDPLTLLLALALVPLALTLRRGRSAA